MPIIGPSRVGRAMLLLAVLLGVSLFAVLYDQNGWTFLDGIGLGGVPSGLVRMGGSLAPLVFVSVTLMILVSEGGTMVADAFREQLQKRRERARERGRAEERARWQDWLGRKQAAERENLPFDEPPPGEE